MVDNHIEGYGRRVRKKERKKERERDKDSRQGTLKDVDDMCSHRYIGASGGWGCQVYTRHLHSMRFVMLSPTSALLDVVIDHQEGSRILTTADIWSACKTLHLIYFISFHIFYIFQLVIGFSYFCNPSSWFSTKIIVSFISFYYLSHRDLWWVI
jgi:hypothetical protein